MTKHTSSRQQIQIKSVQDNILILPGNKYRAILETSALNFELNSDKEQDVVLDTFQHFLNALPCPIQILVRVRELDIDDYIATFQEKLEKEKEAIFRQQLTDYCSFVKGLVAGNRILSRKFYIVIPFEPSERAHDFAYIKDQLQLYQDVVTRELERVGIKVHRLGNLELLNLFYSFYNPSKLKSQPLTLETIRTLERDVV